MKNNMIGSILNKKYCNILVQKTVKREIIWNNIEYLKSFLRKNKTYLNTYQALHEYLVYLQKDEFIFDCSASYFSISENKLLAFAKEKNSYSYRLDYMNLEKGTLEWQYISFSILELLRIRNVIELLFPSTTDDMCSRFIAAITSDEMGEQSIPLTVSDSLA